MIEENSEKIVENEENWEAPALPEEIEVKRPEMSEAGTVGNVFIEPGRTFADLRIKPRFIMAGIIVAILVAVFQIMFIEKIGFEKIVRTRIESSSGAQQMPADAREEMIEQQSGPVVKYITYAVVPVALIAFFFFGGLLYFAGMRAMGSEAGYLHGVSVWVYSSLPPTVLFVLVNIIILVLKSAEDIDLANNQGNLAPTSPAFFVNASEMPVMAAVLSTFDLFSIFGWILAGIGLKTVGKISTFSAAAIVMMVALIWVTFRVIGALFS